MKKIFLMMILALSVGSFAQSTEKEDLDIIQAKYGKSKKELVNVYMNLSGEKATAFWKTYDAYEVERKNLGKEKMRIINEYAANYDNLTDAKADEIAKATLKNNMDFEKLISKYYDKTKKDIGAVNAAKFIQIEVSLQTAVRSEIQNAIPLIGEM
ncbi:hypothetical protein ACSVH2_06945 [Flavobacterium sp. RSB2_4_14]|uniref:hypothetical protein n=1 Tax=Flavobacterium sp. RSB2_4_14 TaxID=3447665 RepID=UPI003F389176